MSFLEVRVALRHMAEEQEGRIEARIEHVDEDAAMNAARNALR